MALVNLEALPSLTLVNKRGGKRGRNRFAHALDHHLSAILQQAQAGDCSVFLSTPPHPAPVPPAAHPSSIPSRPAQPDPIAPRLKHVEDLVHNNHVSRAVQTLFQESILDPESNNGRPIQLLQNLHPPCPNPLPSPPSNAPLRVSCNDDNLDLVIRRAANGSGPSPSGWTGELVKVLLDDNDCMRGLAALLTDIRNGALDARAKNYLLGSRLLAHPKGQDKVRPIAIGSLFYKLAALHLIVPMGEELAAILQPCSQFGVGVPGGVEIVGHLLQELLLRPGNCGFAADFRNAFNEVDRAHLLSEVFADSSFKQMWRMVHWAYSDTSPLWILGKDGKLKATLHSENGVRQGDPLAPALFAIAVRSIYTRALCAGNGQVKAFSILDDITFVGPPPAVLVCVQELRSAAQEIGLFLQPGKCQFMWFHPDALDGQVSSAISDLRVPTISDATVVVGTPVGRDRDKIVRLLHDIVNDHHRFFHAIQHRDLANDIADRLLLLSGIPRMNFLLRTVEPSLIRQAAIAFDQQVWTAAVSKLDIPNLSGAAASQLQQPARRSGLGLRNMEWLSPIAYLSGVAQAAPFLREHASRPSALSLANLNRVVHNVRLAIGNQSRRAVVPLDHNEDVQLLQPGWRRRGVCRTYAKGFEEVAEIAEDNSRVPQLDPTGFARVTACRAAGSGLWLTAATRSLDLHMSNDSFRRAVRLRLGLAPSDNMPTTCGRCGFHLSDDPWHFLSCSRLASTMLDQRHNQVCQILAIWCRRAGASVVLEPTCLDNRNQNRPDLHVITPTSSTFPSPTPPPPQTWFRQPVL